jgi:hypothetical protein
MQVFPTQTRPESETARAGDKEVTDGAGEKEGTDASYPSQTGPESEVAIGIDPSKNGPEDKTNADNNNATNKVTDELNKHVETNKGKPKLLRTFMPKLVRLTLPITWIIFLLINCAEL